MDKAFIHGARGRGFKPNARPFLFFFNFIYLKLAVTFLGGFGRSTNFHILIHMPIRSYHININSGVGWSHFLILLSKSHIFSPKNLGFFFVKIFWVVLANNQYYQIDPWTSAVVPSYQTQKIWSDFWTAYTAQSTDKDFAKGFFKYLQSAIGTI